GLAAIGAGAGAGGAFVTTSRSVRFGAAGCEASKWEILTGSETGAATGTSFAPGGKFRTTGVSGSGSFGNGGATVSGSVLEITGAGAGFGRSGNRGKSRSAPIFTRQPTTWPSIALNAIRIGRLVLAASRRVFEISCSISRSNPKPEIGSSPSVKNSM